MRYAYILDNKIHNFVEGPLENLYPPEFIAKCVPCEDTEVSENWILTEAGFIPPITNIESVIDIEQLKASKLKKVQEEKSRALDAGFLVNGTLFDSDGPARIAYIELAMLLEREPTYSTFWKASSGVWVTMNAELFAQVYSIGKEHVKSCFNWQSAKETEIASAKTVEEVIAINTTYSL